LTFVNFKNVIALNFLGKISPMAWNTSRNNITMNLVKIAYCVYGKISGNFSSGIFAAGIHLDAFTRTNAQRVSSQKKSRKRRKSGLTVVTMEG